MSLVEKSENQWQDIESILDNYSLKVQYCEKFGTIDKIYTDKGVFALKNIQPHSGMDFIRNVQMLYQRGYNRIVPIYITMDGRYGVLYNGRLHYLMPWLANAESGERNEKHKQMFRELARMHTLSVKDVSVKKEERESHYDKTIEQWTKQKEFLEEFVEKCERNWYMSPFQLMYCSYFVDISQALSYSVKKLNEWYEKSKDDTKLRTVVTHGKLSTQHFLFDDRGYGYFINFENAKVAPPHYDLLPFLVRSSKTYPVQSNDCIDWLYTYFKFFSFKEEEMLLFVSYLAHPGYMIRIVEDYHRNPSKQSELKFVQQLQRNYWLLKNIEYIVMRIEEIEQQKKAAQQQPQSS